MSDNSKKSRLGLPIDHERAPKFKKEVTPSLKGGCLEKSVNKTNNNPC